jgi:cytochrome c oxidase cbb3-type subunit 3
MFPALRHYLAALAALLSLCIDWPALGAEVGQLPEGRPPPRELVEKGEAIFSATCAICHGQNARGGAAGAPNLTLSTIAMANDGGMQLAAFLQVGRPARGMPARPVTEEEAQGLSAKLRSLGFAATDPQPPASFGMRLLVGDAKAGEQFFNGPVGRCAGCHPVAGGETGPAANLAGVATRYKDPKTLQNAMVLPGRRFYWSPANSADVTAIATYRDGRQVRGLLDSVSDFKLFIRDQSGKETVLERRGGEPRVELRDRLQAHLDLLAKYRDNDIHDLTAYLATLK